MKSVATQADRVCNTIESFMRNGQAAQAAVDRIIAQCTPAIEDKPIEIKAHVRVENGRFLSNANASKIVVRSDRVCSNVIHRGIDPKTYKETYRIHKDKNGYCFREVTHGMGICGYRRNVRLLVMTALVRHDYLHVFFEP